MEMIFIFHALWLLLDCFCKRWLSVAKKFVCLMLLRLLKRCVEFALSFSHREDSLFSTRTFIPQSWLFWFLTLILGFLFQNFGVLVCDLIDQGALMLKVGLLLQ